MDYDVIIIGAGPSGLNAALYCGRANLKTLVLESQGPGGQLNYTSDIDNYIGFSGSGASLTGAMYNQAQKFGADFKTEKVLEVSLGRNGEKIVTTRRNNYSAKAIIISTGASPRLLNTDGEERLKGAGVSYCATCDGAFYKDKIVSVIGGGNTAFEEAEYLSRFCEHVYLIHRRDTFRASASLIQRVKQNKKITILTNESVEKIQGETSVKSLVLKHTLSSRISVLETSGVFIAAGRLPNNQLVKDFVKLDKNGYIVTDQNMRTSVNGIYAVGDVRNTPLRQIITACADGAIAANDISTLI